MSTVKKIKIGGTEFDIQASASNVYLSDGTTTVADELDKKDITVTKETTATSGSIATYTIKQNSTQVGDKIEIPEGGLIDSIKVDGTALTISSTDKSVTLPTASATGSGLVKVDTALSATSTNPVTNSAVTTALGTLSNLTTTAKTSSVAAINELDALQGNDTLTTTATTLTGAVNELDAGKVDLGTATSGQLAVFDGTDKIKGQSIDTAWATTPTNTTVPGAKLVKDSIDEKTVTVVKETTANTNMSATYTVKQNGAQVGVQIDIPEGIAEAPKDGKWYVRQDGAWVDSQLSVVDGKLCITY